MTNPSSAFDFQFVQVKLPPAPGYQKPRFWVQDINQFDQTTASLSKMIEELISNEMKTWNGEENAHWIDKPFKLIFALGETSDLVDQEVYGKLFLNPEGSPTTTASPVLPLRQVSKTPSERMEKYKPRPMILITEDDVMELEAERKKLKRQGKKEEANGAEKEEQSLIKKRISQLDPRFRFFDSSIWHRHLSLFPLETFKDRLIDLTEKMLHYHRIGLYHTILAHEFLEFECRKLLQSYYTDLVSGHAKNVTPYRFHSEGKMALLAQEPEAVISHLNWSCLIVDDYYQRPLRGLTGGKKPPDYKHPRTKANLILNLLNRENRSLIHILNQEDPELPDTAGASQTERPLTPYRSLAESHLKSYKGADIILLDYYLGYADGRPKNQYAHHLLSDMMLAENRKEWRLDLEANWWVFPISAFDHSFQNHWRTKGENGIREHLEMQAGADPVNTPEQFRNLFIRFLEVHFLKSTLGLDRLIEDLYARMVKSPTSKEGVDLRLLLREKYAQVANIHARYLRLVELASKDQHGGNGQQGFIRSYLAAIDKAGVMGKICASIHHLGYLIAFGTNADQPKMWQEFNLLDIWQKELVFDNPDLEENLQHGKEVLTRIRNYIISLK
ncbi:MAG: hypothetical protein AAFR61_11100 [Bacteroidota bacterium]